MAHIDTSVNFEGGQTSATVPVVIVMDTVMEPAETFTVSLSLPDIPRVELGDNTVASVIITDAGTYIFKWSTGDDEDPEYHRVQ